MGVIAIGSLLVVSCMFLFCESVSCLDQTPPMCCRRCRANGPLVSASIGDRSDCKPGIQAVGLSRIVRMASDLFVACSKRNQTAGMILALRWSRETSHFQVASQVDIGAARRLGGIFHAYLAPLVPLEGSCTPSDSLITDRSMGTCLGIPGVVYLLLSTSLMLMQGTRDLLSGIMLDMI